MSVAHSAALEAFTGRAIAAAMLEGTAESPESEPALRPFVEAMVARAPRLPGWEVYAGRQPGPVPDLASVVTGKTRIAGPVSTSLMGGSPPMAPTRRGRA